VTEIIIIIIHVFVAVIVVVAAVVVVGRDSSDGIATCYGLGGPV